MQENPNSSRAQVSFNELPFGDYVIAILHDENRSGGMDYNLLHLPKEGYGFSNTVAARLKPPSFHAAKFTIDTSEGMTASIKVRY